jgi:hypothetical protein
MWGDPFRGWRTKAGIAEAREIAREKELTRMRGEAPMELGASFHGTRQDPAEVMAKALSFRPAKPPGRP